MEIMHVPGLATGEESSL